VGSAPPAPLLAPVPPLAVTPPLADCPPEPDPPLAGPPDPPEAQAENPAENSAKSKAGANLGFRRSMHESYVLSRAALIALFDDDRIAS
jgi:hypothetical protein